MTVVVGVDGTPGSHPAIRTGLQAARYRGTRLLGTVSQYVLRQAPCPVLVVPAGI